MTKFLLAVILLNLGCGNESSNPSVLAAKNVPLSLFAPDIISSADIDYPIQWTVVSTPAGASAQLSSKTEDRIIFLADASGQYELRMSFGSGQSLASYPFFVNVENQVPVVVSQEDTTGPVSLPIPLFVVEAEDSNGDQMQFEWQVDQTPPTSELLNASLSQSTFIPDVVGEYTLRLLAIDEEGGVGSSTFQVTATPNFKIRVMPFTGDGPRLAIDGRYMLYANNHKLAVATNGGTFTEVEIPQLGSVRIERIALFRDGELGIVTTANQKLHRIDTALGRVTETFNLDRSYSLIGVSDNGVYLRFRGIWSLDFSTGAITQLLSESVLSIAYDDVQNAFYSSSPSSFSSSLHKWIFEQGTLVEAGSIPTSSNGILRLSSTKGELIDFATGSIYSIDANPSLDFVKTGSFLRGIRDVVNPDNQDWRVTFESETGNFGDSVPFVYSEGARARLTTSPIVYDNNNFEITKLLGVFEGQSINEVVLLFNSNQVRHGTVVSSETMTGTFSVLPQ